MKIVLEKFTDHNGEEWEVFIEDYELLAEVSPGVRLIDRIVADDQDIGDWKKYHPVLNEHGYITKAGNLTAKYRVQPP